jgi:hypothetical protein
MRKASGYRTGKTAVFRADADGKNDGRRERVKRGTPELSGCKADVGDDRVDESIRRCVPCLIS